MLLTIFDPIPDSYIEVRSTFFYPFLTVAVMGIIIEMLKYSSSKGVYREASQ